ncbi:putative F-box protein [Aphelenchoides fujianensis]|nr:putative F-box protein [Aphelenchoides fujianensis]
MIRQKHRREIVDLTVEYLLNFVTEKGRWKLFSGVEQLWIVVTRCPSAMLHEFEEVESDLFTELNQLTVQIHYNEQDLENVARLLSLLAARHSNLKLDVELHANNSKRIFHQLEHFEKLQLNCLKLTPKRKIVSKVPFIRRMEIAGSFAVTDLLFLADSQHEELEKQIRSKIPELQVEASDVYYFD